MSNTKNNSAKLSWGLFMTPRTLVGDIKTFAKRVVFLLKNGYCPQGNWETFYWFIDVFQNILKEYRYHRSGTPIVIDNYLLPDGSYNDEENEKAFNNIIDRMLELLPLMDEENELYDNCSLKEESDAMEKAKDEFFSLFSKYFYSFWD